MRKSKNLSPTMYAKKIYPNMQPKQTLNALPSALRNLTEAQMDNQNKPEKPTVDKHLLVRVKELERTVEKLKTDIVIIQKVLTRR